MHKDANNVEAYLKVLNECGEDITRFVSHYLDELPPVTFTNMDVCGLLRKMEHLHAEIIAMKQAAHLQAEASEGLRAVAVDMNKRVCALELCAGQGGVLLDLVEVDSADSVAGERRDVCGLKGTEGQVLPDVDGAALVEGSGGATPLPRSPMWSLVAKRGERQLRKQAVAKPACRVGTTMAGRGKAGKSVVGTGSAGNIKMIKTKLVSVFASKFSHDLEAEALRAYLRDKLGHDVTCLKIVTGMPLLKFLLNVTK